MALDSDSDDDELILASDSKHTEPLSTTPEPNDDDFILKHKQITQKLSKSRRKRKREITNDINDIEILSQQTNYSYTNEPLLHPNDNICNTPPPKKRKRNMANKRISLTAKDKEEIKARRINILSELIPKNTQNINIVSSDTNSSSQNTQNTQNTNEPIENNNNQNNNTMSDNENVNKPYLFGDDTNEAMKIIMENEPYTNAKIEREVKDSGKQINKIKSEKERVKQIEEQHRRFMEEFSNNNINKKPKPKPKPKRISLIEKDRMRFENDNAFAASFDTAFKKNKTRKRRRNDNNNNTQYENRNKRHKSDSLSNTIKSPKKSRKHNSNDPFIINLPKGFNILQPKVKQTEKKKPIRRKKYSKSNRVSRTRNISNISSQLRASDDTNVIPGSKLLDALTRNTQYTQPSSSKKHKHHTISNKKRKQKKNPFAITKPILASPFKSIQTPPNCMSLKTPNIRPKQKTNVSSIIKSKEKDNMPCIPLSKQLDKLTANDTLTIENNNKEMRIFSTLPHSHKTKKINRNICEEDIEEMRTTNEDLQYLHTPQRFKYRARMQTQTQNENDKTPENIRIVSKMKTPKKKNDKQEMDASDDDVIECDVTGNTPKWLSELANKAMKKKDEITPNKPIKKKRVGSTGKWSKDLRDLTLKIASTYNMVKSYKNDMKKIPATLGVTEKLTMKILRARRVSFYDLYQSVCVYMIGNERDMVQFKYVLCYFDASKFEELKLEQYDFITIYRPWNDMNYCTTDKKYDIGVIGAIDNIIKIYNVKQNVKEYNKYPKYDINVFKKFIVSRQRMLEDENNMKSHMEVNEEINNEEKDGDIEMRGGQNNNVTQIVLDEEDENFWLENIDIIIEAEKKRMNNDFIMIEDIPKYDMDRKYNLRGMIQRIYINPMVYKNKNNNELKDENIELLVSDELGYCCIIVMNLINLLKMAFDSDFNDSIFDQLKHLTKVESIWFEFNELSVYNKNNMNYNQSIESLVMQFQYLYLNKYEMNVNNIVNKCKNIKRESSNCYCNGLELNKGKLIKDSKMYYHFEREVNNNKKYFKRLQLRYFECKSLEKATMENDIINESVMYEESLVYELNDMRLYMDKYWKTSMSSTRISVCVRIIGKSLLFENVIYICDNSLLNNIQCIPLIIENKQLFECVCDLNKSNQWFYEHQPLVILRDIAMYFKNINENNGQLQLKFDMFSMINEINNIELIANKRKCLYKYHLFGAEKNIFNMNELNMTPWKALNSVIIQINGSIELVSINDGFNVKCQKCKKVSMEYYENNSELKDGSDENMNDENSKQVEGVSCMQCLKNNGQVRLVLKRDKEKDEYIVIMISVSNIWYKTNDSNKYSNGIMRVINWENDKQYLSELNKFKMNLCQLVDKGNDKLKQCIIEYKTNNNNNNNSDSVQCYNCFHCVI